MMWKILLVGEGQKLRLRIPQFAPPLTPRKALKNSRNQSLGNPPNDFRNFRDDRPAIELPKPSKNFKPLSKHYYLHHNHSQSFEAHSLISTLTHWYLPTGGTS
jgi:hypothetical protein